MQAHASCNASLGPAGNIDINNIVGINRSSDKKSPGKNNTFN
jgi:hypothetical protein